ncbi:MAG: hypothetical protein LBS01_09730 [Prevotellaceae bacterium]|jgi:hypothetical protein|nr:hypothetical protein [Prevotellaceae bacterium]
MYRGAELNLTPVFADDLHTAKRTVAIVNNDYLQIRDFIQPKQGNTKFTWRMLTTATPTIDDAKTFKLVKNGKTMYLTFNTTAAITLKTWSTAPATDYDLANPGTVLVGFECTLQTGEYTFLTNLTTEESRYKVCTQIIE